VTIPERPGSFKTFCEAIGRRSITEFNYRYAEAEQAHVFVGLSIRDASEIDSLTTQLQSGGYPVYNLSDNEMAKLHIRHMVGGRLPAMVTSGGLPDEVLFRFEFPERPGALMDFLIKLGSRWNISLFHYRNHGAAYGRVLVGMQVPVAERDILTGYFDEIGYRYWDETGNVSYRLFLR
jgi:threonine dehydratase